MRIPPLWWRLAWTASSRTLDVSAPIDHTMALRTGRASEVARSRELAIPRAQAQALRGLPTSPDTLLGIWGYPTQHEGFITDKCVLLLGQRPDGHRTARACPS
jgi:hypothetical protein